MTSIATDSPEPLPPPPPAGPRTFRDWLRDMPRWKKLTVAAAVAIAVAGAVLTLTADAAPAGGNLSNLSSGLTDGRTLPAGNAPPGTGEPAAKGVFRLGFSFVAGFCLGSFVRATLKIAAIAFGFWLCLTLVLNYYGILTVDWQAMDTLWNRFASNVESEWGSFQTFMTGSLPAAGLAATGLVIGLKRH